jgi:hypothetical protein
MMPMATSSPSPTILFASLPNPGLLSALTGFERIDGGELPSEASLLVGRNHAFEKRFGYPRRKPAG